MRITIVTNSAGQVLGGMTDDKETGDGAPKSAGLSALEGQLLHEFDIPRARFEKEGFDVLRRIRVEPSRRVKLTLGPTPGAVEKTPRPPRGKKK